MNSQQALIAYEVDVIDTLPPQKKNNTYRTQNSVVASESYWDRRGYGNNNFYIFNIVSTLSHDLLSNLPHNLPFTIVAADIASCTWIRIGLW